MEYVSLGPTELLVGRSSFSAQFLDEIGDPEKVNALIKKAFDGGINFFETSHLRPESERLLGDAIKDIRNDVIVASRAKLAGVQELRMEVDEILNNLKCEKLDLLVFENPAAIPEEKSMPEFFQTLDFLISSGKVGAFGISTDDIIVAANFLDSCSENKSSPIKVLGFPFNMLCSPAIEEIVIQCSQQNVGFIAEKPLCGGLIENLPLALGYLRRFEDAVPIWGPRNEDELQQILYFTDNPPVLDAQFHKDADTMREFFN